MRVPFVGLLRDDREEVQVPGVDRKTRLLARLAHRAFERGLAGGHLELAAYRAPHAEVRRLRPEHEQVLAGGVLKEDEDGDPVG